MDPSVLDLIAVVGDQTWRTPGWPVGVAVVNAIVGVAVGLGLLVHGRYGGLGQRELGLVTAILTPLIAGLACGLPFVLLPAALMETAEFAIEAFWVPFAIELAGSGTAIIAVLGGLAAWVHAPKGTANGLVPPGPVLPLLVGPIVLALGVAGPAHILALNLHGPLPTLDLDVGPRLHLGTDTTVPVKLDERTAHGWFAPPVRIAPTTPGTLGIEVRAERVGLKGLRLLTREVGEDQGSPLLPLAKGNSWDLEETVHHEAQYLWFVDGDHTSVGSRVHIAVEPGALGPLRTWTVIRTDDTEPAGRWTVYGWNGEVLDLATDQPFVRAGEPTDDHLTECGLEVLAGWQCACGTPPAPPDGLLGDDKPTAWASPWEIAGPARCTRRDQPGAVRAGVGAFLAMITVGLVVDMGDASRTLILTRSSKEPG